MIDIHLYRSRIGNFFPRIRKLKTIKTNDDYLEHRLGRIFLISCIVISILAYFSEGFEEDEKSSNVGFMGVKKYRLTGVNKIQGRTFRVIGVKHTSNYQARMLHGNIKKGIINMHVNIRSIYNKMSEVKNLLKKENPHILGISEAELKKNHDINTLKVPGYDFLLPPSWEVYGKARVVVYIKKSLHYEIVPILQNPEVQTVWFRAGFKNKKKIYFSHQYREHTSTMGSSLASQRKTLEIMLAQWEDAVVHDSHDQFNEVHIMGDMNLDTLNDRWIQPDYSLLSLSKMVLNCCSMNNFSQLVNKVTRVQYNSVSMSTSMSCIDHLYCNSRHRISPVKVISFGSSDHDAILYTRYSKEPTPPSRTIRKRSYKDFKVEDYVTDISKIDFSDVYQSRDVDYAVELLTHKLVAVLNVHAPWIIFQQRKHFVPWLTPETKEMMVERDRCKEQAKDMATSDSDSTSVKQIELWKKYKRLRNTINNNIKKEEIAYKKGKVKDCNGCPSKVWGLAKKLMDWTSPGPPTQLEVEENKKITLYTKARDLSRVMNEFFISKVQKILNGLRQVPEDLSGCRQIMGDRNLSLSLSFITVRKVRSILSSLKSTTSTAVDQLDNFAIKLAAPHIAGPLHHVITLSILQQKFPDTWKLTKIVPLHKKKSTLKKENYRPVAILSPLSKVLEKVLHEQVYHYFERNTLFHPSLHGYRQGRSTMTALLSMYDKWVTAASQGKLSGVVLVDLSAAFDLVSPSLLIKKLQVYGLEDDIINWISSYLTQRYQSVWIDHVYSNFLENSIGVPQGSILGPLLFLIFFNDLPTYMRGDIDCYADDSTVSASAEKIEDIGAVLSHDCEQLSSWMVANSFKLNADKTHLLTIGTSSRLNKVERDMVVTMDGVTLKQSSEKVEELLGVKVQNDLKWSRQIEQLTSKLKTRVAGLQKIRYVMNRGTRKNIVQGVFNSILCYCIPLFGGCNKAELNQLQVQQNRAAQCVLGLPFRTSRSILFEKLGWTTLQQLVAYHTIITIFRIKKKVEPEHLASYLFRDNIYDNIIVKISDKDYYRNSFIYRGSTLWNKAPKFL